MDSVMTGYGRMGVLGGLERYPDGTVRALIPAPGTVADTPLGAFEARHSAVDERKKTGASLEFHPGGELRSIILEERAVVATPAGEVLAEQLIFYPGGELARVFPLCGRTSAYWSAEDEAGLMAPFAAATPAGRLTARFMSLAFDAAGRMRSLTLWPGETVDMDTPAGRMAVRIGAAFYPDGAVRSVEPGRPTPVETPVGRVLAYDPDATGICGDVNSLGFFAWGGISRAAVLRTALAGREASGEVREVRPVFRESLCGTTEMEPVAMRLDFSRESLTVLRAPGEPRTVWPLSGDGAPRAAILPPAGLFSSMAGAACGGAPTGF